MKQMPVEGRKFNKVIYHLEGFPFHLLPMCLQVDRIWRNIMAKTVSDTRVLQATSQPNMLVRDHPTRPDQKRYLVVMKSVLKRVDQWSLDVTYYSSHFSGFDWSNWSLNLICLQLLLMFWCFWCFDVLAVFRKYCMRLRVIRRVGGGAIEFLPRWTCKKQTSCWMRSWRWTGLIITTISPQTTTTNHHHQLPPITITKNMSMVIYISLLR